MRLTEALFGGVGLVLLLLAGAIATGAVAAPVPAARLRGLFGNDYVLVAGLAGLALVAVGAVLLSGRPGRVVAASMPDPETPRTMPTPGDSLDALVGSWSTLRPLAGRRRGDEVRRRLREAAVASLAARSGDGRAAARDRVDAGDWTTDRVAARFLAERTRPGATLLAGLDSLVRGRTPLEWEVARTVAAIEALRDSRRPVNGRPTTEVAALGAEVPTDGLDGRH